MVITTNRKPRPILYRWELSEAENKEFDYLPADEGQFFRYKGQLYELGEFVQICPQGSKGGPFAHYDHTGELAGWDGIATDSFFSGVLVKLVDDDSVVVGLLTT